MAAAFEYRYSFSVDEEIIRRYDLNWSGLKCIFKTRINFIVKGISGEQITLDCESFEVSDFSEGYVRLHIGRRLRDCWMPDRQIRTIIQQFIAFAKQQQIRAARRIPAAAVDVEVCTVQREGEAMAAAVERAMKPEHLPPLHLYPLEGIGHPTPPPPYLRDHDIRYLKAMATIWVEDVETAMSVMDLCVLCGRKPIVGTQILKLLCGHHFHYHCVAQRLLRETNSCPTCNHQPAYNQHPSFDSFFKYDNAGYDSSEEDDEVWNNDNDDEVWNNDNDDEGDHSSIAAEAFWSRLLDNDNDDDDDESDPDYDPDQGSDLDD